MDYMVNSKSIHVNQNIKISLLIIKFIFNDIGGARMLTSEVIAKQFKLKKFLMAMYKDAGIDFTKEKIRLFESNGEYNKVTFFNDIDDLVSFSTKKQRIYKNTTAAYVIYLIPKGYECAYINHWIAIFMFEKELLLNRGSKCRVVGIKKVFGKECYILKLI